MPRKTPLDFDFRSRSHSGFNEAAARCRGKLPRGIRSPPYPRRFNEAAARCRGKRVRSRAPGGWSSRCFNEAAARCRGKRLVRVELGRGLGLQ